ncbi:hypothetical protein K431DRAFT_291429 [Polychaeton citri CBS 116435]|uniref:Uncharacterized protein n=1 Tax=Polychaeton citri CBS 116435 TaxID=1314669 RepID=A0A9P4QE64_9PEZI|nr:hypothetical protein K431DRAFT_291429 [Polychaeton citri CBS 116435]
MLYRAQIRDAQAHATKVAEKSQEEGHGAFAGSHHVSANASGMIAAVEPTVAKGKNVVQRSITGIAIAGGCGRDGDGQPGKKELWAVGLLYEGDGSEPMQQYVCSRAITPEGARFAAMQHGLLQRLTTSNWPKCCVDSRGLTPPSAAIDLATPEQRIIRRTATLYDVAWDTPCKRPATVERKGVGGTKRAMLNR